MDVIQEMLRAVAKRVGRLGGHRPVLRRPPDEGTGPRTARRPETSSDSHRVSQMEGVPADQCPDYYDDQRDALTAARICSQHYGEVVAASPTDYGCWAFEFSPRVRALREPRYCPFCCQRPCKCSDFDRR
jgi:hypothetical protein